MHLGLLFILLFLGLNLLHNFHGVLNKKKIIIKKHLGLLFILLFLGLDLLHNFHGVFE